MPTSYPGALDEFTPITNGTVTKRNVAPTLSTRLNNLQDAVAKIQEVLGVDIDKDHLSQPKNNLKQLLDEIQVTIDAVRDILHGGTERSYLSSITPNPSRGFLKIGPLTGNITLNAPSGSPTIGDWLTIEVVQDGTGGRTVTFNSVYKGVTAAGTTANRASIWQFRYDGSAWIQVAANVNVQV